MRKTSTALSTKPTRTILLHFAWRRVLLGLAFAFLASGGVLAQQCACINSQLNIGIGPSGFLPVGALLQNYDPAVCTGPYAITVRDEFAVQTYAVGQDSVIVPNQNLGELLSIEVTSQSGSCTVSAVVEDKLAPEITCPPDTVVACNTSTAPIFTGQPQVTDNTNGPISIDVGELPRAGIGCYDAEIRDTITRFFIATDQFGNSDTCFQQILVQGFTLAEVEFPADTSVNCSGGSTDPSSTGRPRFMGNDLFTGGNCNITVNIEDAVIDNGCTGGETVQTILRAFTLTSDCDPVGIVRDTQIIRTIDTIPPVFTSCAVEVTIGATSASDCFGSLQGNIPFPTATDNCDNMVSIGIMFDFNIDTIPVGQDTIFFSATDDCGNSSTCFSVINIVDDVVPQANCLSVVTASISSSPSSVPAASFDQGSFDNCAPVLLEVSRNGGPFGPSVPISCADAGDTLQVTLRVSQTNDPSLFSTCDAILIVEDKLAPAITCPAPPAPIDCGDLDGLTDFSVFGTAQVFDNCDVTLVESVNLDALDMCGAGTVVRTFTATDAAGNTSSCVQTIEVQNLTPFDGSGIQFPQDLSFEDQCPLFTGQLVPDSLPSGFDRPVLPSDNCAMLVASYSDQTFFGQNGSCFKIFRTWAVIDWCSYSPANPTGGGIFTDIQVIEVNDNIAPNLTVPADMTVSLTDNCSTAFAQLTATATDNCGGPVTITNNSPFAGGGASADGNYPFGTPTTVTFRAEDACGNFTTAQTTVTVLDLKKPSPACGFGLVLELGQMGDEMMATAQAAMLDAGSFDNCPGPLEFRIRRGTGSATVPATTELSFTCDDLGDNPVEFWAIDQAGNADYCVTFIQIQDNMLMCPDNQGDPLVGSIGGTIQTEDGLQIAGVSLQANGIDYTTDDSGDYLFELPTGQSYSVQPLRTDDPTNGVTALDLAIINRHILGITPLDSPYRCLAADANGSGSITALDIVILRRLILQLDAELPNNVPSWRFVCADYQWQDPTDPLGENFPEVFTVAPLTGDVVSDFIGIKMGDVNGSVE